MSFTDIYDIKQNYILLVKNAKFMGGLDIIIYFNTF